MTERTITSEQGDRRFVAHARTVMALTLLSRISGLVRDAVCSRLFGAGPIWSAFALAFVLPNLFRRLFGEGAISAAFIPEYAQQVKHRPEIAARFASLAVAGMLVVLGAGVVVIELVLLLVLRHAGDDARRVILLAMIMLPYMPLVCTTAMLGGMLQTHGKFVPHAAAPILLNVCMVVGASVLGFGLGWPLEHAIIGVAVSVVVAGGLQLSWCIVALRGITTWSRTFEGAADPARTMLRKLGPVLIGMGTLQLGTLIDGVLAGWPLLFGPTVGGVAYPMDTASASVLYFANRLYQFPLGVFGIAIATAVFPALARAADEPASFIATLRRGLRLSLFIGAPATIGLVLVARPLAATIYAGGAFGASDVDRVTWTLLAFAPGVWAYGLTHVFTRAFFASGNTTLPMRVGIATVCLNLALNLGLMWPLAERGLALATSLAAIAQCITLAVLARRRLPGTISETLLDDPTLRAAAAFVIGCIVIVGLVLFGRTVLPISGEGWGAAFASLGRDTLIGAAGYLGIAAALRRPELGWLVRRSG